jgi:ADP-heptose:LPS heptosyltransferase
VLVVRLDGAGDVLLAGPAIRAVARRGQVSVLCGPAGVEAAALLPGVREVLEWSAPWIVSPAPAVDAADLTDLVERVRSRAFSEAVVLTSFHQSPLPTALLLRLAGVPRITGASVDYAGSLLNVRLVPGEDLPEDIPEPERALRIAGAAGFALPADDAGGLAVSGSVELSPSVGRSLTGGRMPGEAPVVVLHPGAAVQARRWPSGHFARLAGLLDRAGCRVVVTGGPDERTLTALVAGSVGQDLGGATTLAQLADVLARADALVVGNTSAAHLAAAVGTPVVSLFAPVVPATRWAPYRVPQVLLGDQDAPCRDSRARTCPIAGHPCLSGVSPEKVLESVLEMVGHRAEVPA